MYSTSSLCECSSSSREKSKSHIWNVPRKFIRITARKFKVASLRGSHGDDGTEEAADDLEFQNKVFEDEERLGEVIDGMVIKLGLVVDVFVGNALVGMYGKCGVVDESFDLLMEMLGEEGLLPDVVTVVTILPVCAREGEVDIGMGIHGLAMKLGSLVNGLIFNLVTAISLAMNGLICRLVTVISLAMNGLISLTEAEPCRRILQEGSGECRHNAEEKLINGCDDKAFEDPCSECISMVTREGPGSTNGYIESRTDDI
ncbi:hypothetical protein DKX38_006031 [Salix brachista]|uniref:Uncharacterized protein n=1 Tax=Salix brachista TaxID=2182728 RepID=A0A5N5N113_9ROSI|nr:hypothetical protein DKX38_006031 [Salix brachista]